jgi:hypothetical protein
MMKRKSKKRERERFKERESWSQTFSVKFEASFEPLTTMDSGELVLDITMIETKEQLQGANIWSETPIRGFG